MTRRLRSQTVVVAAVLALIAVAVFGIARHVVADDSRRLLHGQAGEVGALLTNSFSGVDASLRSLAVVADASDPTHSAFVQSARPLVVGQTRAIMLVNVTPASVLERAAMVGDGVPDGPLAGSRAALIRRAAQEPGLVSGVIVDGSRRRIGLARGPWPAQDGWVVYQESAIDPGNANQPTTAPAFQNIDVALYASTTADPKQLVLSTTRSVPTDRSAAKLLVPVGVDEWLVVATSDEPLAGNFATAVPWLLLVVGLATAFLCSAMVEVVSRRRDYALALVDERTAALTASVQELEAAQAELVRHAHNDDLTGLANRFVLIDRLENALARGSRAGGAVVVMFIDLDRFKVVNDSLGHDAGDQLLIAVGQRLLGAVRPGDTVARLGGDEFVILCEGSSDEASAWVLAERLQEAIAEPFNLAGREVTVSMSVGLAVARGGDAITADGVLRDADLAMYRAKELGRDRIEAFDEAMRRAAGVRLERESAIRRGLAEGEFAVYYQPILELPTSTVVGVEALVRWIQPDGTVVAPDDFVPLAEDSGLIAALGAVVLVEACTEVANWNASRPDQPQLYLSVNLSARQLDRDDLMRLVEDALAASGLDPSLLALEITESTLMDADAARDVLEGLKGLGATLVVDDFGTGYSSLMYLRRLPVDAVKIDKSFVSGLGRNDEDTAIVAAVVRLAGALGLHTIAEGVETADQHAALTALGCEFGQGFHWSTPQPAASIRAWLAEREAAESTLALND
jgi:diguanylate cyclase (GGDEF)-like protein